ncbi:MAG: methyltransferase [Verrucomicrobiales bacterium]|nr:methyltransferase [Verrucomicrobiales bacterium]|tara:strand:+ start:3584 stop:4627 length:1044 start_codon:yes stop_codon:yes gene_type:complete
MSANLRNAPVTDPAQILRYRDRQYAAELLAAAIVHFDFFTWLNDNAGADTKAICEHFEFAPRPADVLLTLLRANGFLTTNDDDRHELTELAREHLVRGSDWFLGPYYAPIQDTPIVHEFLKVLRTGKPANWQAKEDGNDWHESMLSEEFARGFTELMNCRGKAFGQKLAQALAPELKDGKRVLDVGGGSGIYACTMVAAHPHLEAIVMEQAPVDQIAREEIVRHKLEGSVSVTTANMFADPWPRDADVVLLSNVLHDWDFPEVRMLLERSAETLPAGGLLIIHEAFINDDKTGPLPVAEYSALLMNITQGKCYTPAEYGSILNELGFETGPHRKTIADRGFMTAIRR